MLLDQGISPFWLGREATFRRRPDILKNLPHF